MAHGYLVWVYAAYAAISIGLVMWIARTLFRNGAVFLEDVFRDQPALAIAVNRLLVVGFYLLNLGYAALILRADYGGETMTTAIEVLSKKLGGLLLTLGALHFVNLYIFYRIRRRALLKHAGMPVLPQLMVHPAQPAPMR